MSRTKRLRCFFLLVLIAFSVHFSKAMPLLENDNDTNISYLTTLLAKIKQERNYAIIAVCQTHARDCIFQSILPVLPTSVLIINRRVKHKYKTLFSKELLVLLCLEEHSDSVATAWAKLNAFRTMKQTRIVAYAAHATQLEQIRDFCLDAMANDFYNVLIILKDFGETQNYYTCNKYPLDAPRFKTKSLAVNGESSIIFEQQFVNMYGAPILYYPDQLEPRSMLYYKPDGGLQLEGYVGRVLRVFAQRRNATLKLDQPYEVGKALFYGVLLDMVKNNTMDMGVGLVFVFTNYKDFDYLLYPLQQLDYCYMIPLPATVPINELFIGIIKLPTLFCILVFIVIFAALLTHINKRMQINFINLFLNDQAIRGMLGQSFVLAVQPGLKLKLVIFLLCYMSIITNTTYQAYLQAFLTSPPLQPMHRSYEDIEAAGLTISFSQRELDLIHSHQNLSQYRHLLEIVPAYDDWLRQRTSLNTKYVFPVSNLRWKIFDFQQTFFERPLFYFNQDMCFFRGAPIAIPVRLDLPYRDLLEDFTLRLHAAGIFSIWMSMNFYVMVRLKKIVFRDLSIPLDTGRPLVVNDFIWIRTHYLVIIALGCLTFVGECAYFRWKNRKQRALSKNKKIGK